MVLTTTSAYTFNKNNQNNGLSRQQDASTNRRAFFQQSLPIAVGVTASVMGFSSPVWAAEEVVLPTKATVQASFDAIRYELQSPEGGVSYMQARIDAQDWAGLLEFTKTYDQELRKLKMGKAKKLLQSKELKEKATEYANAVTFDLIGINRNSRQGQENVEGANKYLQELRDDVNTFLTLEATIQTEG